MRTEETRVRRARRRRLLAGTVILASTAIVLAACGKAESPAAGTNGPAASFTPGAQSASAPITVWVDSTRLPAAQAYAKANPSQKINIVTYSGDASGASDLQTKIELYDRSGSGWPDAVFSAENNDATWGAYGSTDWLAPLNQGLVPQSTLSGFAPGALGVCTINGVVYCLRNDLAQDVLWYNKTLMANFGYRVPTTWEQFQALGAKLSAQHPGYVMGGLGDANMADTYFAASRCPSGEADGNTITINTASSDCTRMAAVLDAGIKNKSLTTLSELGSDYTKQYGSKTLLVVGPSWFGQYVINALWKVPGGQVAAALPPQWPGESPATGNVGGGIWMVSKHSKNLAAAARFVEAMTTDDSIQAKAPTYPAYGPAAVAWLANQAQSGYFANNVGPVFQKAAAEVWSGWSATRFSPEATWGSTVIPGLTNGKTLSSLLPALQAALVNQAKVAGYTVQTG